MGAWCPDGPQKIQLDENRCGVFAAANKLRIGRFTGVEFSKRLILFESEALAQVCDLSVYQTKRLYPMMEVCKAADLGNRK